MFKRANKKSSLVFVVDDASLSADSSMSTRTDRVLSADSSREDGKPSSHRDRDRDRRKDRHSDDGQQNPSRHDERRKHRSGSRSRADREHRGERKSDESPRRRHRDRTDENGSRHRTERTDENASRHRRERTDENGTRRHRDRTDESRSRRQSSSSRNNPPPHPPSTQNGRQLANGTLAQQETPSQRSDTPVQRPESQSGSQPSRPKDNKLTSNGRENFAQLETKSIRYDGDKNLNNLDVNKLEAGMKPLNTDSGDIDTTVQLREADKGLRFRDGQRIIDFILVYEEFIEKKEKSGAEKFKRWREKFLKNLKKAGLQLEDERTENDKKLITFIKLHAPWDVCCAYAEDLSIRAPLQAHPNPTSNGSARFLEFLHIRNIMQQEVPNTPLDYYTCPFKKSKLERFLGNEDKENFFEETHRHRILWEILSTTVYGKKKRAEIGIERLLDEGGFSAAFPLHDGSYKTKNTGLEPHQFNKRQVLHRYWARWGAWHKYQPLDHIREYFGEKIGIYFAWLGFYTAWLLPASIVGVLVFLFGLVTFHQNKPADEVCDSGESFKMCPLCDEDINCEYWYLSDVCLFVRISYLFDHPGTVVYAVFVSFWAVSFLEYWKRKNASLAHHWDCSDFEEEEERPRPEYAARAPDIKENPITGINEPYFDPRQRLPRILSGIAAIIIMICLVLIFIIAVIMYRVLISIPLFEDANLRSRASSIASMSAAVVNLIIIMTLGRVYEKLALKLTQWEMHRTQTEFEDQLTFKVFIFQFVNFYSSIIYVGFFKGKFVGYPGHYNRLFGLRMEECNNGGCLVELAQQLGVIMIGKQIINNAQEIIIPKVKGYIHRWKARLEKKVALPRWEEDYQLIENEGLFQEYLEMVLQFGFITIFVAAFPLAPLFALLNNWVEIRLDAHKFVCETRRPVAERAQDIGVWFTILEALGKLAVISNAFLIAFTSEFLPRLLYQYEYDRDLDGYINFTLAVAPNNTMKETCRYRDFRDGDGNHTMFYWKLLTIRLAFVIVFEHVVFGICRIIDIMVPDVPETLELKIKRERYLAKQALADTDTIMMMAKRNEGEEDENIAVVVDATGDAAADAARI